MQRAKIVVSTNDAETIGHTHSKKINQDTDLNTIYTHTQWITNLNIKYKTMKLLQDNICNLEFADNFLGKMLKAKSMTNGTL